MQVQLGKKIKSTGKIMHLNTTTQ